MLRDLQLKFTSSGITRGRGRSSEAPERRPHRQIVYLITLFIVAACAPVRPLAVREHQLTLRVALPLDEGGRGQIVEFIAASGRRDGGGTVVVPMQAVEKEFGRLLDLLKDPQNLRVPAFEQRLTRVIPPGGKETPVIDATEEYPDEVGRVAYLLQNFWFVFYAQRESQAGDALPPEEWVFTRVAIFRDRPPA